ncbi:uncharacterized protein LOC121036687 [Herpailurus yagouaroundi]|uniref:uncharacterized protein LOC121036687 n=1 Tax=Herpailurus yagouaroundi TaxID=1608482 RepID=UPI001AD67B52|nr:uncharacterized protein LOC121036687 [Puma yagouaroundi]
MLHTLQVFSSWLLEIHTRPLLSLRLHPTLPLASSRRGPWPQEAVFLGGRVSSGWLMPAPCRSFWSTGKHHVSFSCQMPSRPVGPPSPPCNRTAPASLLRLEFSRWAQEPRCRCRQMLADAGWLSLELSLLSSLVSKQHQHLRCEGSVNIQPEACVISDTTLFPVGGDHLFPHPPPHHCSEGSLPQKRVSCVIPCTDLLKAVGISCDGRNKGVFCYINEVTFGKPGRTEAVVRGAYPVVEGWRLQPPARAPPHQGSGARD